MQVFNTYFKIAKKNIRSLLIYFCVFLALSVLLVTQKGDEFTNKSFNSSKTKVVIFNYDKESNFSNKLEEFISNNSDSFSIFI